MVRPHSALYIQDIFIIPFFTPIAFGTINIEVESYDDLSGVSYVEFYIDALLFKVDSEEPYSYFWESLSFFHHHVNISVFDYVNNSAFISLRVWKFF